MGLIGISLGGRSPKPAAEAIRSRVQAVFASQT
jgi:hypothetical protein